jgi:hypothetical protein
MDGASAKPLTRRHKGRPKGYPNRITRKGRGVIVNFIETHSDQISGWLSRVAKDDPKAALDIFLRACEYYIPKLQRTELVGDPDRPVYVTRHDDTLKARLLAEIPQARLEMLLAERPVILDVEAQEYDITIEPADG